jgi:hypothetical protein
MLKTHKQPLSLMSVYDERMEMYRKLCYWKLLEGLKTKDYLRKGEGFV